MKKNVLLLACFLLLFAKSYSQDAITVCQLATHDKFILIASSSKFKAEHQLPRVYTHTSQQGGKMISFKCPDGSEAKGYFLAAKSKTDNWILVFQEWWGLNDNIKRQSEELFNSLGNVNVLALDMYDGQLATEREGALKLIQAFKQERGDMIVKGALAYAGTKAKIGTIGWCFGGSQSLMASLTAGKQAVACVIYYGMPTDDVEKLKTLNTDVLGIFGTRDKHITPEAVKAFEANMKTAGKKLTVKNYDADHGFANPSNEIFDKAATEDAWKNTIEFFKARLK
jgi:carboxymethylenebutenolidase